MKTLAIITARGGSKRIPRKNIKAFLGKPIIAYSIETALASGLFDEVMVSTDDEEIAAIAIEYGAKVPFTRSTATSNDYAPTVDVLIEVLDQYAAKGEEPVFVCCIYPTAPFVSPELLGKAFRLLEEKALDTVFPVLPFSFPIQRALKINEQDKIELFQAEHMMSRSQDLEKAYHDAGQFYWCKVEKLRAGGKLWTDNTEVLILSEMEAHDIDYPEDWEVAEFKYQILKNGRSA